MIHYNKFLEKLATLQATAIWESHGNYSKYVFLFHCEELLDEYSELVDEKNFNSMQEMREKYQDQQRWRDMTISWLKIALPDLKAS